jgi:hypothetical protein
MCWFEIEADTPILSLSQTPRKVEACGNLIEWPVLGRVGHRP